MVCIYVWRTLLFIMGYRQGSLAHILLDILYAGSLFAIHWHFQNQLSSIPIDNKGLEEAQERPPRWWQLEHLSSEERLVEMGLFSLDGFRWTWQKLQYLLGSLWGDRFRPLRWSLTKEYKTLGINWNKRCLGWDSTWASIYTGCSVE